MHAVIRVGRRAEGHIQYRLLITVRYCSCLPLSVSYEDSFELHASFAALLVMCIFRPGRYSSTTHYCHVLYDVDRRAFQWSMAQQVAEIGSLRV